jgi:deaminated glutathione amidase
VSTFSIVGIQLDAPVADNLALMSRQIEVTCRRFPWVEMIVFGELCAFGPRVGTAQPTPGPAETHFCGLAKKHGIWLVPGSIYEQSGDAVFNTAPVINPEGEVVTRCRKLFPFLPFEQGVSSGSEFTTFEVPNVGTFGVSICYDMWFPETTRALVAKGAEVIIHPTLTNTIDRDVELSIARANAAMNQCYFFDVNNTGDLGYGKSIIVSPEGKTLHQAERGQEVMPVEVDFDLVRRVRETGSLGLGQPLKSFRDANLKYPAYENNPSSMPGFSGLGSLELPKKSDRSDIRLID